MAVAASRGDGRINQVGKVRHGGTSRNDSVEVDISTIGGPHRGCQQVGVGRDRDGFVLVAGGTLSDLTISLPERMNKDEVGPYTADGAIEQLVAYDWPGNVREQENVIERALIQNKGRQLKSAGLTREIDVRSAAAPQRFRGLIRAPRATG